MSNGTSVEEKAVTDKGVTDADLEIAQTAEEEKVVETREEVVEKSSEEEPEEPTEHGERSKMGRRVARMEQTFERLISKLDSINYPTDRDTRRGRESVVEEEIPQVVSTPEDVERVINARDKKRQEEQGKYEQGYISTLNKLRPANLDSKEEVELHESIMDLMETEWKVFGTRRSDYPDLDAELNYSKAKAAVLGRKMASPKPIKPNVKGERSAVSTNLSVNTTTETPTPTGLPPLDEHATDFVKYLHKQGVKDESIKESFKGETPISLVKR